MKKSSIEKPESFFSDANVKGASMNEWATKTGKVNSELSRRLNVSRDEAFLAVDRMHLPRYERFSVDLNEFLENPDIHFNKLKSFFCYFNLKPLKDGLPEFRQPGVTPKQVLEFIKSNIPKESVVNYRLTVSEYYENEYGGNIIVEKDGSVKVEFRKGSQGPISHGNVVPEFFVESDPYTKVLKYSFDDESLKKVIYSTLSKIPHDEENGYMPGYYEFQLVEKDKQANLEPVFIDYKNDPAYFLNPNETKDLSKQRGEA